MNSNDRKNLIIFILLVIAIIGISIFNVYKNRDLKVDRKVEYIFNRFTYDTVLNEGNNLFFQTIELLNKKNSLEYERNRNESYKYYSINNYNNYRRITNFMLVTDTLKKSEVNEFMKLKKIIKYENSYYIETYKEEYNKTYVGSILDIESYDNNFVYFNSTNYYCNNSEYIGSLEKAPNCDYTSSNTKFTLTLENNNLRVNSLEEIKNILK